MSIEIDSPVEAKREQGRKLSGQRWTLTKAKREVRGNGFVSCERLHYILLRSGSAAAEEPREPRKKEGVPKESASPRFNATAPHLLPNNGRLIAIRFIEASRNQHQHKTHHSVTSCLRDEGGDGRGREHKVIRYLPRLFDKLPGGSTPQLAVLRRPERQQPPSVVDDRRELGATRDLQREGGHKGKRQEIYAD